VTTKIDPADLLDAGEVATVLGLTKRTSVSVYRGRYPDFPPPIVAKNSGKCDLWLRGEIEAWAAGRR
jgi:predicted DNA-binding transcriptional regulator AlpA